MQTPFSHIFDNTTLQGTTRKKLSRPAIVLIASLLAFAAVSDYFVQTRPAIPNDIWAIYDNIAHGIIAGLVLLPLGRRYGYAKVFIVGYLLGAGIDIDHAIAAKSLHLEDMLSIGMRPFSHSLFFAVASGVAAALISRKSLFGWFVFAALASHVLRDAGLSDTPIWWPVASAQIPLAWYYLGIIAILLATLVIAARTSSTRG